MRPLTPGVLAAARGGDLMAPPTEVVALILQKRGGSRVSALGVCGRPWGRLWHIWVLVRKGSPLAKRWS
jgi:hypothetical protein